MKLLKKAIFEHAIPFVGRLFRKKNRFVNVIYYHDIVTGDGYGSQKTNLELFKKQMQYLCDKGYQTLVFDELDDEANYAPKKVLITFDDGWRSNYTEIFAFMREKGIKYNIFLEVGKIGEDANYLTWDMVREMQASGVVGFGAHTYSHPDMSDISAIDCAREFAFADKKIEEELGFSPKDFCYPFGKWSEASNAYVLQNTGYTRVYTSDMMYSYRQDGKIVFGRSSVNGDRPFSVFKHMLSGNYSIFNTLRGKKHG